MTWSWRGGPLDTVVTFALEPVDDGTRLIVEHCGFRGMRSRLVQLILGIGNHTLYGRRLPQLLYELEQRPPADPSTSDPAACMSWSQRLLILATSWLPGRQRPPAR